MNDLSGVAPSESYFLQVLALSRLSAVRLVRSPQAPQRAEVARRLRQNALVLAAGGAVVIVALMLTFDAIEIGLMRHGARQACGRSVSSTDFGKTPMCCRCCGNVARNRAHCAAPAGAVAHAVAAVRHACSISVFGRAGPGADGRGNQMGGGPRPSFVGGKADPFNFAPSTEPRPISVCLRATRSRLARWRFAIAAIWRGRGS